MSNPLVFFIGKSLAGLKQEVSSDFCQMQPTLTALQSWGGGGTPIYGLYRYVPPDRVWFLRFPILK